LLGEENQQVLQLRFEPSTQIQSRGAIFSTATFSLYSSIEIYFSHEELDMVSSFHARNKMLSIFCQQEKR
jgi:hypothetical protein